MPRSFDAEHIPPGAKLELYISPSCPYCRRAMGYYESVGTPYTCYDAQGDRSARDRMLTYTNGDPTVPAIVVNGKYEQSGWGSPPQG